VVSGRVKIMHTLESGEEVTKSILSAGEVFGEMAIGGQERRTDFAVSMDKQTQVCAIPLSEVKELMHSQADMSLRIIKWMGFRIQRLERRIELLCFKDARTRVVEFLRDAAAYKGKPIAGETLIRTKLTHQDIASLTGSSRQTVSEIMNQLRAEGQIYFERGKILVHNITTLA